MQTRTVFLVFLSEIAKKRPVKFQKLKLFWQNDQTNCPSVADRFADIFSEIPACPPDRDKWLVVALFFEKTGKKEKIFL